MTTHTTQTIRVRTSEGTVLVPVERSVFRIESLESEFGKVVGFAQASWVWCVDCWIKATDPPIDSHSPEEETTDEVPLTTETDEDYYYYCDTCGIKLDLRYTPNASDGERRHASTRSSWTNP